MESDSHAGSALCWSNRAVIQRAKTIEEFPKTVGDFGKHVRLRFVRSSANHHGQGAADEIRRAACAVVALDVRLVDRGSGGVEVGEVVRVVTGLLTLKRPDSDLRVGAVASTREW